MEYTEEDISNMTSSFNEELSELLNANSDYMEVLALPAKAQHWLIALYTFTILLALVGNILVIVVLSLGNRTKKDLTKYLLNLAVADLTMTCFCMPFTFTKVMLGRWIFGPVLCPGVLFMQVTSVTASIYTNVAIGIDRYLAVTCPLWQRATKSNVPLVIGGIWVGSVAMGSVQLVIARAQTRNFMGIQYYDCGEVWTTYRDRNIFNIFMVTSTYVLPLLVLAVSYYKVGVALWKRETPGNADVSRDQIRINSKRKVTKMLMTIVFLFMLCWLPIQLFILVVDLAPSLLNNITTTFEEYIYLGMFYVCHWIAMANSFMNPIIYCFLNENFRMDMRYLLRHNRCRKQCCPCIYLDLVGGLRHRSSYIPRTSSNPIRSFSRNASSSSSSHGTGGGYHKTSREIPAQVCKCSSSFVMLPSDKLKKGENKGADNNLTTF